MSSSTFSAGELAVTNPVGRLFDPARDEHVGVVRARRRQAVGRERERFSVRREHRKAVETGRRRDALEVRTVHVDGENVELAPFRIAVIARKNDAFSRRMPGRTERRRVEVGDLNRLRAVRVRDVDFELARANQALVEQGAVVVELLLVLRTRRSPDDLRAVGTEVRPAVVARSVRQPDDVLAVRVHPVELEIAVADRREDDRAVFLAHGRFGVVALRRRQANGARCRPCSPCRCRGRGGARRSPGCDRAAAGIRGSRLRLTKR